MSRSARAALEAGSKAVEVAVMEPTDNKSLALDLPPLAPSTQSLVVAAQRDPTVTRKVNGAFNRIKEAIQDVSVRDSLSGEVQKLGLNAQTESTRRSGMLNQKIQHLAQSSTEGSQIADLLINLRREVKNLDPGQIRTWNMPSVMEYLLGWVPLFGPSLQRYMARFQTAQVVLDEITGSLGKGAEGLERDTITLSEDRESYRKDEKTLVYYATVGLNLREKLIEFSQTLPDGSDERTFVETELVFPLNQRIIDLLTDAHVTQQGVIATKILVDNNKELGNAVTRAQTTTMKALRIGVSIAVALNNQARVLKGVIAAKEASEAIISSNAKRLRTQGADIHKLASGSMIDLGVLKRAFTDVNAALDDIEKYRRESLPKMAQNIAELQDLTSESEARIERMEKGERVRKSSKFLDLEIGS